MSSSNHSNVPGGNAPPSEIRRPPGPALVVAVVLVLVAGFLLLLGAAGTALSSMDTGLTDPRPVAIGAALALSLVAAAVLAARGHCGRWWVLGLSALTPATDVVLTTTAGWRPETVMVSVVGWLALVFLSYVRPFSQWWARIP